MRTSVLSNVFFQLRLSPDEQKQAFREADQQPPRVTERRSRRRFPAQLIFFAARNHVADTAFLHAYLVCRSSSP